MSATVFLNAFVVTTGGEEYVREGRDLSSAEAFASNLDVPFDELELTKLIGGGGFGQVTRKAAALQPNAEYRRTAWYRKIGASKHCAKLFTSPVYGARARARTRPSSVVVVVLAVKFTMSDIY